MTVCNWTGMIEGVPANCDSTAVDGRFCEFHGGKVGKKHDGEKLPVDLVTPDLIKSVAAVLRMGAEKYGRHNWKKGLEYHRVYAATLRHLLAFAEGERTDAESGLPHLSHALCELMFLSYYINSGAYQQFDDMPEDGVSEL
jgi:hypothetical protein